MPRLLRGMARTAVVAGTATAVSGRVQRRQADKFAQRDGQAAAEREQAYAQTVPQAAPAAAPAPAPASTESVIQQLQQLGDLKTQGILTEAEFETQKAKLLSS